MAYGDFNGDLKYIYVIFHNFSTDFVTINELKNQIFVYIWDVESKMFNKN